ncbi:MAG: dTMP kinase [Antricoccus sp.]
MSEATDIASVPTSGPGESALRGLLRIKAFRRMWLSIGISSFGDWLALLATVVMAQQLTQSASTATQGFAISGVLVVRLLPDLIFAPIAGAIADRLDRRKTVIIGEILAGLLYLSIAAAYNLTYLYIAQFVIEAIGLFVMASKQTLWMSTVSKDKIALGNQVLMLTIYGSFPVAALLNALLSTFNRFFTTQPVDPAQANVKLAVSIALCLDALSYFVSAVTIYLNRKYLRARAEQASEHAGIVALIREGARFVFKDRNIRVLYVGVIGAFAAGGITVGVAKLYVNTLNAGSAGFSVLVGTAFTGLAIGMLTGPRVLPTLGRRHVFGSAIAGAGLSLIGMALVRDFAFGLGFAFGVGLFAGMAWILGYTMIGEQVEDRLRGRTFSFVVSSARITLMLSLAIGSGLAGVLGSHKFSLGQLEFGVTGPGLALLIAGFFAFAIGLFAARRGSEGRSGGFGDALRREVSRRSEILFGPTVGTGLLVVIEGAGLDQTREFAKRLAADLESDGLPVVLTGEPTDSKTGRATGSVLQALSQGATTEPSTSTQATILLAAADRAQHIKDVIAPALERGDIVVCDRFVDTDVIFFGTDPAVDAEEVMRVSAWGAGDLRADVTVVVDDLHAPERLRVGFADLIERSAAGYKLVPASGDESYRNALDYVRFAAERNAARIGPRAVPAKAAVPESEATPADVGQPD